MNQRFIITLCIFIVPLGNLVYGDAWDTVILRDDFNVAGSLPDSNLWGVNWGASTWGVLGRTLFPSQVNQPAGPFPYIENGECIIEQHTYNPYDTSHMTLLGGEIHTLMQFDPNRAYRFEARVKNNQYPNGLVTSFFTYGYDGSKSDEIDFEFLSNKTNDNVNYPGGDPFPVNTWNESQQWPQYVVNGGLNLNNWNTFRIYWYPGQQIVWTWMDPVNGETLLRSETTSGRIPDEPMQLFFNFWAPTSDWPDAYSADLQPADNLGQNQIYKYEIDYVEVCVPEPSAISSILVAGLVFAGLTMSRRKHN